MRITYLACTLGVLLACTPGTGTTDTTTDTDTTGSQTTSATGPGGTTTTAAPTTGTDTNATSTDASTGVVTSATTEPATTEPGETGTTGATTGTTGATTGATDNNCVVDADCVLHSDCCTCEGVRFDVDVPVCDLRCEQSQCDALSIDQAVCRLGVCETERLHCDQAVACDQAPPACPPNHLPETTDACYTGKCVSAALCDVVTDCALCPADMMCVQQVSFGVDSITCEPIPPGCGGVVDCACVGDLVCTGMYTACFAEGAVVSCECPSC